jgi:hypothetical protein
MDSIPLKEIVLVMFGGLFGWTLGKLPPAWIYAVLAVAILLTIVVVM